MELDSKLIVFDLDETLLVGNSHYEFASFFLRRSLD